VGVISYNVNVNEVRDKLQNAAEDYVKHIWSARRRACVEAAGDALNAHGYLPSGTEWDAVGNNCEFYVEKNGANLTHYFHEGIQYGPNFFVKKIGEWRSPANKPKKPIHAITTQEQYSPAGVAHWTRAFEHDGALLADFEARCAEILRR
jgi:hypothetical protein